MGCCPSSSVSTFKLPKPSQPYNPSVYMQTPITQNYEVHGTLGYGTSATVRKATSRHLGITFAVKSFSKERTDIKVSDIHKEMQALKQLDHPNIVKLHEVYEESRAIHFVMDHCDGGELFDKLAQRGTFNEKETAKIIQALLYAANHIHHQGLMHLDLKPENILFVNKNNDSDVKIIDLGLAVKTTEVYKPRAPVGTPSYIAPEAINGIYTIKADIWSIGVIMYTLLIGYQPFNGNSKYKLYNSIKRGKYPTRTAEFMALSENAKDMIKLLLCTNHYKRPYASDALAHPWFADQIFSKDYFKFNFNTRNFTNKYRHECFGIARFLIDLDKECAIFKRLDIEKVGIIENFENWNGELKFSDFLIGAIENVEDEILEKVMRCLAAAENSLIKMAILESEDQSFSFQNLKNLIS